MSLAEAWIEKGWDIPIAAVECGFVWWADEKTVIVGVQDLLTSEMRHDSSSSEVIIVGNEWKTTKESSKWWNEDKWLESISVGSQIAIYGLAMQNGTYYPKVGEPITPKVREPRIRVRAISKSTPPVIWPRRAEDGIITLSPKRLEATRQALLSEAESIRARRKKVGLDGIWRIPGTWCINQFKRKCEFYEDCVEQKYASPTMAFNMDDPAARLAVPHIDKIDNDIVILSASSYSKASECVEAYRRSLVTLEGERSMALDTGSVFHSVVAEFYRQIQEQQLPI